MASTCSRARGAGGGVLRQEADAGGEGVGAVGGRRRQFEVDDIAQQFDGQLDQDARAVAAVGLGARGTAVFEVFQGDQPVGDDGVRATALDVGDHGDATGVGLVAPGRTAPGHRGNAENSIWKVPPQSGEMSRPGLQRPE